MTDTDSDPRPIPPEKLLPGDCCDSGCARCVRDTYMDQRAAYKKRLAEWKLRHPDDGAAAAEPVPSLPGASR